jgi:hypothetical protein
MRNKNLFNVIEPQEHIELLVSSLVGPADLLVLSQPVTIPELVADNTVPHIGVGIGLIVFVFSSSVRGHRCRQRVSQLESMNLWSGTI